MKQIEIHTSATIFNDISELSVGDKNLMNHAIQARKSAYAPYSNFNVGAAILLDNHQIVMGSNQENAAYPSGMCAERVAIWKAGSEYPNIKILKIAVSASSSISRLEKPAGPCGGCRQALLEYEIKQQQEFEVLFMGEVGEIIKINSLNALLPFSFNNSFL